MRPGWFALLLLVVPTLFANEIYRSFDEHGRPQYSDKPSPEAQTIPQPARPYRYRYRLAHVIDGDTLIAEPDRRIRLLGINTPEVSYRGRAAEPGGEQARAWLRDRLDTEQIIVEYDQEKFDKYQRELAYVFSEDKLINTELLAEGLAVLTLRPPNLRYSEQFIEAQEKAEKQRKGLWQKARYQALDADSLGQVDDYRGWRRWQMTPRKISAGRHYLDLIVSDSLKIRIHQSDLQYFPEPADWLERPLEVRGWMSRRGEQYAIRVYHPSSVVVLQ